VGLAHVAQPSYLTSILLWRSFLSSSIRCCVRAGVLSGFPSSSVCRRLFLGRRSRGDRPTISRRSLDDRPTRRSQQVATLPCGLTEVVASAVGGRAAARPSHGFGPVVGARCRPPMSKITFPLVQPHPFNGNRNPSPPLGTIPQQKTQPLYPIPLPKTSRDFGNLKFCGPKMVVLTVIARYVTYRNM